MSARTSIRRQGGPTSLPLGRNPQIRHRERTQWNVRDANITLLFTLNAQLTGGSLQTLKFAKQLGKTCLHIHPQALQEQAQKIIRDLQNVPNGIYNIAGSRESKEAGIYHFTRAALDLIFFHGLQSMHIYLDDLRPMPAQFHANPKTAPEAIGYLRTGHIEYFSFDHDLGDDSAGSGYDVARFIEEQAFLGQLPPLKWHVHSANPVGAERIRQAMVNAEKYWNLRASSN